MRAWKDDEAFPPHLAVSVDDERIVEIFAAHTAGTENVVRWENVSAWARGSVAKWLPDAIVFLTATPPSYEASINAIASGTDTLLHALDQRRVTRLSLEKLREQVSWRQRAKVDELLERRFSPAERSMVREAFASSAQFSSPYVQLAALNLAGSDVERIVRTTRGIDDMTEFLHASEQKAIAAPMMSRVNKSSAGESCPLSTQDHRSARHLGVTRVLVLKGGRTAGLLTGGSEVSERTFGRLLRGVRGSACRRRLVVLFTTAHPSRSSRPDRCWKLRTKTSPRPPRLLS